MADEPDEIGSRGGEAFPRTLLRFCEALRRGGISVYTSSVMDALKAIDFVDIFNRREFHDTLLATLVKRKEDRILFEKLFHTFWQSGNSPYRKRIPITLSGSEEPRERDAGAALGTEPKKAKGVGSDRTEEGRGDTPASTSVAAATYSPVEVLMKRDLASFTDDDDMDEIERLMRRAAREIASARTRTTHPAERGIIDLRRTVRTNMQYGMELLEIVRQRKRIRRNRLVLLCDVSGSMKTYSNFATKYLYAMRKVFERIEIFVFSTRLTRVTSELQRDDFGETIGLLSDSVPQWGGGTKIGACLNTLLERYGHLIDRRTIMIIISDGMDTGEVALLEDRMKRLKQRSRWVAWLNPLLADPAYEPVCRGMQTALPYADTFTSANTVLELQRFTQMLRDEPALRVRG